MLKLTIETKDAVSAAQIQSAYDYAIEATTFERFETALHFKLDSDSTIVGRGGSHLFISDCKTGERKAIILI